MAELLNDYCSFISLIQCIVYIDFTFYHQIVQENCCVKIEASERILYNGRRLRCGPLICFCLLTVLQMSDYLAKRKKKHLNWFLPQLNQPHFSQSLLQMTFDCSPSPKPPSVNKDYHHRNYWKVCAVDSKSRFKSRVLKTFGAIAVGLNWETNSLKADTEEIAALIWVYMLWMHIDFCIYIQIYIYIEPLSIYSLKSRKLSLSWLFCTEITDTWGTRAMGRNNGDTMSVQHSS